MNQYESDGDIAEYFIIIDHPQRQQHKDHEVVYQEVSYIYLLLGMFQNGFFYGFV